MSSITQLLKDIENVILLFPFENMEEISVTIVTNNDSIFPTSYDLRNAGFKEEDDGIYVYKESFFESTPLGGEAFKITEVNILVKHEMQ